jgi:hypothetical protein
LKNDEKTSMSDIYAMQRANGDWFAFDHDGRLRVPLFHGSHDAMMARLRNFGMLLFKPVALDAGLLREMAPAGAGSDVDFCIVNDPFASLSRGSLVEQAQLALLMRNPREGQTVANTGSDFHLHILKALPQNDTAATETWEVEGGEYAKCA